MENPKLRRLLVLLHLFGAAFMAPAFLLVAMTGGLHMLGDGEKLETTALTMPAGIEINTKSKNLEADVRAALNTANIDHKFEYVKVRGSTLQLRPTSRPYIELKPAPDGWSATMNTPNLQKAMMEVHKGHGPLILRTYHKIMAVTLFLVVFGGIFVGLLAKAYRRKTIVALATGVVVYVVMLTVL